MGEAIQSIHSRYLEPIIARSKLTPLKHLVAERVGFEGFNQTFRDIQMTVLAENSTPYSLSRLDPDEADIYRISQFSLLLDPSAVEFLKLLQGIRRFTLGKGHTEVVEGEHGLRRYADVYWEAVRFGARPDSGRVVGITRTLVRTQMVVAEVSLIQRVMNEIRKGSHGNELPSRTDPENGGSLILLKMDANEPLLIG